MNPYVKSVQPQDDYCLLLTFENGEKRAFDLKPYLNKGVFARLQNTALYKNVRVVSGSVEWPGEIDLSYDTLYLGSKPVNTITTKRKPNSVRGRKPAVSRVKKAKQREMPAEAG